MNDEFMVTVAQLWNQGWRWIVAIGVLWAVVSLVPRTNAQVRSHLLPLEWVAFLLVVSIQMIARQRLASPAGMMLWALWLITAVVAPESLTIAAWHHGLQESFMQWVFASKFFAEVTLVLLVALGTFQVMVALISLLVSRLGRMNEAR